VRQGSQILHGSYQKAYTEGRSEEQCGWPSAENERETPIVSTSHAFLKNFKHTGRALLIGLVKKRRAGDSETKQHCPGLSENGEVSQSLKGVCRRSNLNGGAKDGLAPRV